jgi:uncharacterized membrane protein YdbT with pleckstrin-like domain
VLLPHLVLVIACVVMFLLVFFKLGHSEPAGPARVIMVYATSAVAVVYVLWLLGLFLWRKVGVRFELHKNSLVVRKGIFGRSEDETPLVRVNDVSVKRTFTQRILGVCTVDVISTDSTDVDRTNDEQRKLLGLKSGEGVLELMDMPKLLPKATEELRKQIRAAAEEKKLPIDDAHFGGGEVDQVIQNRMHWIREHILVVVDSGN